MSQSVVLAWLDRLDPGTHRRIKGLRLVTAFGLASMLGRMPEIVAGLTHGAALSSLAGWFALWASVSEARVTRLDSTRDLILLCVAAALGSASYIVLAPMLQSVGPAGSELALISGAFLVGYLKRFGLTGAGIGSQLFIGQLLAYGGEMTAADLPAVAVAALLAAIASIVPRVLSGPAEIPALPPPADKDRFRGPAGLAPELTMGLQAAVANDPAAYGVTNTTSACYDGQIDGSASPGTTSPTVCATPGQYEYFDGEHPGVVMHQLQAAGLKRLLVPEPGEMALSLAALGLMGFSRMRRPSR